MSVFRKNGRYYVGYRPEGKTGPYVRIPLDPSATKEEAQAVNASILSGLRKRKGIIPVSGSTSIAELWPRYLAYIDLHRKPGTLTVSTTSGKHIVRILGTINLKYILPANIEMYQTKRRKEGVQNGTVNKELIWLSGLMTWAKKNGIEVADLKIERLPYDRKIPVILTPQECMAIMNHLPPLYRGFVGCMYLMGMRAGAVRNLLKRNVDLEQGVIYVEISKTGPTKKVIPQSLLAVLRQVPDNPSDYFFLTKRGVPPKHMEIPLEKARIAAGITKKVHPHIFRHSMGAHLTDMDINIRKVQEFLDHSNIKTTEWYTQVAEHNKREVADRIDDLISGVPKVSPDHPETIE